MEISVLFFAHRIDDLSDFRERGVYAAREDENQERRKAEPGENLSVFALTLTLTVKVLKTCNKLLQPPN